MDDGEDDEDAAEATDEQKVALTSSRTRSGRVSRPPVQIDEAFNRSKATPLRDGSADGSEYYVVLFSFQCVFLQIYSVHFDKLSKDVTQVPLSKRYVTAIYVGSGAI